MLRYGCLVRCGGMRNAFVSGALSVLQDVSCFRRIDQWWSQSSGSQTVVAFVTGQIEKTKKIWVEELTSPRLCGVRSMLACRRIADVDHLVDHCCRSLDFSLLSKASAPVLVGVVNIETVATEYFQLASDNARDLLKATCALPALARPVTIAGQTYIDGGTLDPLPVVEIMRRVDRLIIFDNRPKYEPEPQRRGIERILFPGNRAMQVMLAERPQRIARSWELVRQLEIEGRILVIAPSTKVASRLCRDPLVIERAWQVGEEAALDHLSQIREFLSV